MVSCSHFSAGLSKTGLTGGRIKELMKLSETKHLSLKKINFMKRFATSKEGLAVILRLKDKYVLYQVEDDALVNVNYS